MELRIVHYYVDAPNPPVLRQSASVVGMSERQRVE